MTKNITKNSVSIAYSTILTFIAVGTVVFHYLEDWTWIQAFYFSVATITTVGYGDLAPTNDMTRLVVAVYILAAVSAVAAALAVIGNDYLENKKKKEFKAKRKTKK